MNNLKLEVTGVLSGVDFRKANEFTNSETGELVKYGSQLKLQFSFNKKVFKDGIESISQGTFTVLVPFRNNESIELEVVKYNKLIGKTLSLEIQNFEKLELLSDLASIKEVKNPFDDKKVA